MVGVFVWVFVTVGVFVVVEVGLGVLDVVGVIVGVTVAVGVGAGVVGSFINMGILNGIKTLLLSTLMLESIL